MRAVSVAGVNPTEPLASIDAKWAVAMPCSCRSLFAIRNSQIRGSLLGWCARSRSEREITRGWANGRRRTAHSELRTANSDCQTATSEDSLPRIRQPSLESVDTLAPPVGTAFAHCTRGMRRHHEAVTSAILPALSMLIPAAGVLWARWLSIRATTAPTQKAKGDS